MSCVALWTCVAAQGQDSFTNGLMAYYPFNGNANDASGNGNNGTVNGATLTADRLGLSDSAYRFNGTSWIQLPDAILPVAAPELTISAWVLADSGPYTTGAMLVHLSSRRGECGLAIANAASWTCAAHLQSSGWFGSEGPMLTNEWAQVVGIYKQGQVHPVLGQWFPDTKQRNTQRTFVSRRILPVEFSDWDL